MAKKKAQKKEEEVIIENIEKEVVSFDNQEVNIEKSIEELDSLIEEIEPIDMTKDLEEIRKEIFEEEPKKEEPKEEVKVEPKKEEPKTIKNKIIGTANKLFGFTWNGMEYDY
jgi:thymidylate synthase